MVRCTLIQESTSSKRALLAAREKGLLVGSTHCHFRSLATLLTKRSFVTVSVYATAGGYPTHPSPADVEKQATLITFSPAS